MRNESDSVCQKTKIIIIGYRVCSIESGAEGVSRVFDNARANVERTATDDNEIHSRKISEDGRNAGERQCGLGTRAKDDVVLERGRTGVRRARRASSKSAAPKMTADRSGTAVRTFRLR